MEGVRQPHRDQHVVGQDRGVEKLEDAVLRRLDGRDVALERGEGGAQFAAGLSEQPPGLPVVVAPVGVAADHAALPVLLLFHRQLHMLVDFGKALTHLLRAQPEQVDDHHVTRPRRQISPVPIWPHMAFEPGALAEAEGFRLPRRDDEAGAVQFDAG